MPTFKPKKQQIHVPGFGVVQKEDFTQEHFRILIGRAGNKRDAFIKQYFVVESYDDLPIFEQEKVTDPLADAPKVVKEKPKAGKKGKATKAAKKAEEQAEKKAAEAEKEAELSDEETLNLLIEEEERTKTEKPGE